MTSERPRPSLHLTAARGWTNDPHGIVHDGDAYHLYFQHVPGATTWAPHCHWGHATSTDLVHWVEHRVALAPEPPEVGCWSGSAVVEDGRPSLLYTRIVDAADTDRAAVVLARADVAGGWRRQVVIDGPPDGFDVVAFRDPQVRADGDRWRAVLGGGLVGVGGCALQYSSADLERWTFDGELASRPDRDGDGDADGGVRTGSVWECPQLVALGGRHVLLVSAWWEGLPRYVAYAVGDLVGTRFVAGTWRRFAYGDPAYATTTFTDVDGRCCAMSWLRERNDHDPARSPWASAMSLVHVLELDRDRLRVRPHPALDAALPVTRSGLPADLGDPGPTWRLRVAVGGAEAESAADLLTVGEGGGGWRVRVDPGRVTLTAGDEMLLDLPLDGRTGSARSGRHDLALDVVADADIVEVTAPTATGFGAVRLPQSSVGGPIRLRADSATLSTAWLSTPG